MQVEHIRNGIRYTLSNEDLRVGDSVFPIANGRCLDNGGWILHGFDFRDFISGFPDDPHIIEDLNYDSSQQGKDYQVKTNYGYSPIERYYKIIRMEEKLKVRDNIFGGSIYEWIEINQK